MFAMDDAQSFASKLKLHPESTQVYKKCRNRAVHVHVFKVGKGVKITCFIS